MSAVIRLCWRSEKGWATHAQEEWDQGRGVMCARMGLVLWAFVGEKCRSWLIGPREVYKRFEVLYTLAHSHMYLGFYPLSMV